MNTYTCSRCSRDLPITEFHKDRTTKGHYSICRQCRSVSDQRILNDLLSNARKRAAKRGLPCTITREDILALNERQQGLCAYTHIPLNWEVGNSGGKQRICPPDRVSLDRIDSTLGYVVGNVHLVTDFVNRIKTWYPEPDFVRFCRLVIAGFDH